MCRSWVKSFPSILVKIVFNVKGLTDVEVLRHLRLMNRFVCRTRRCQIDSCGLVGEKLILLLHHILVKLFVGKKSSHILKLNSTWSLQLGNMRYINLSDGRKLCSDCHFTTIMDTETCIPLFHEVYRFFRGLNMRIVEDIPIFLIDKHEIKNAGLGGKVCTYCVMHISF